MSELSIEERRLRRAQFHEKLRRAELREGFSYLDDEQFVTRPYWPHEPKNRIQPHIWKWPEVRRLTEESGEMIGLGRGAEKYDRRVLALTNPGVGDEFTLSGPLFGDIQLIRPGESAPCHRHTPSATRFILNGMGGWTTVAGEKINVRPGDVVYTGQFPWHDHGNAGADDFIFLDVLDIPLQYFMATSAWEFDYETVSGSRDNVHQPVKVTDFQTDIFGQADLRPCFKTSWSRNPEDMAHLRWSRTRALLLEMSSERGCPYDGIRLELTDSRGNSVGRAVAIYTQMLRSREVTLAHRHTTSTVYVAVEGGGEVVIEDRRFAFEPNDIFVIPSWHWHHFENCSGSPAFLHSINEAALIGKLGLYREQRRTPSGEVIDSGWCDRINK